ncbi:hypothetical protein BB559_004041 [Furculomyces boomerangus]|uniref:Uncharacterized protein n=1 Tax=Furculomyces boomerangus TaxID=61424 RepID=A0A2T9YH38_9FUNG|nr:hypothetical protein BB559_004041 [Furculomyces boomerangus]
MNTISIEENTAPAFKKQKLETVYSIDDSDNSDIEKDVQENRTAENDEKTDFEVPETQTHKEPTMEEIFDNFNLKRIVRENHGDPIKQICFNFVKPQNVKESEPKHEEMDCDEEKSEESDSVPTKTESFIVQTDIEFVYNQGQTHKDHEDSSNIILAISNQQVNVYDNEHCGDHLDIMSHFSAAQNDILLSACWVPAKSDSVFVTGYESGKTGIFSVAYSKEICTIEAHNDKVIDVQPHPTIPKLFLSVSLDGTTKLWDYEKNLCLCRFDYGASVSSFSKDGKYIATGSKNGEVRMWEIPDFVDFEESRNYPKIYTVEDSNLIHSGKKHYGSKNDCIRVLNGTILVKNIGGRFELFDIQSKDLIKSFNVPDNGESSCKFDVRQVNDENYVCVGNSSGSVYIFEVKTGRVVRKLSHKRSVRPVTSCVFSKSCRNLIYSNDSSFLWRYDYIDAKMMKKWESLSNSEDPKEH